jgi:hypothetical protein
MKITDYTSFCSVVSAMIICLKSQKNKVQLVEQKMNTQKNMFISTNQVKIDAGTVNIQIKTGDLTLNVEIKNTKLN